MKVASLFSGAGALDLGLEKAGHEVILLCDSDPGARQVLKQAFPGILVYEDVASIAELPKDTELLSAGFPCIDVSRAGLRKGLEGQSTSLVRHVFRLLRKSKEQHRPIPWVLLENVEALLDRHGELPPVMSYIIQQFMQIGYGSWSYRIVSSAGFGVPNRRKRVFLIASWSGDARDVLLTQGMQRCPGGCKALFKGRPCYTCHMEELSEREHDEDITYCIDLGNALSPPGEDIVPTFTTCNDRMLLLLPDGRNGMLRVEDAERLQGLPEGWTAACYPVATPGITAHRTGRATRDTDVDAHSARRWDLLGNAVTVQVAQWLGERLKTPYAYKYHGVNSKDRRMDALIASCVDGSGVGGGGSGSGGNGSGGGDPYSSSKTAVPNLWSFVTTDDLQEATLFPYLVGTAADAKAAADAADAAAAAATAAAQEEAGGSGDPDGARPSSRATVIAAASIAATAAEDMVQRPSGLRQAAGSLAPSPTTHLATTPSDADTTIGVVEARVAEEDSPDVPLTCSPSLPLPSRKSKRSIQDNYGDDAETAALAAASEIVAAGGGTGEDELGDREMFRAVLLGRVEDGTLQVGPRVQEPWDRDSWPRCAWWVRGLGAFAVQNTDECPVLTPFQPIGEFIGDVGRAHTEEEGDIYVNRLKERGWQLSPGLLNRFKGGSGGTGRLNESSAEISRLPGLISDSEMVGAIVWAPDRIAGISWPAEVLDPLSLPPGRDLPEGALEQLTPEQRRASTPSHDGTYDPGQASAKDRRVLVVYFPVGSSKWAWQDPAKTEPWEFSQGLERAANAALRDSKFKMRDQLKWALQDAKASYALREGKGGQEAERVKQTRAAAAAAGVNLKQRCGRCKPCSAFFPGTRRYDCLAQRMKAAALAGHAGAQVAVQGEAALGARVAVWWDGDQTFFEGTVCFYNAANTEHCIAYDDGELGMHRLWQHDERIRVLNDPKKWLEEAAKARATHRAALERLQARKFKSKAAAAALAAAASLLSPSALSPPAAAGGVAPPQLTDYELQREANITQNQLAFNSLLGEPRFTTAEPIADAPLLAPPLPAGNGNGEEPAAPAVHAAPEAPLEVGQGSNALVPGEGSQEAPVAGPLAEECTFCWGIENEYHGLPIEVCSDCKFSVAHSLCIPRVNKVSKEGWRCQDCAVKAAAAKKAASGAGAGDKRGAPKRRGRPPKKMKLEQVQEKSSEAPVV